MGSNMTVNSSIIKNSIEHYGVDVQSTVCMEECAELIQAISKEKRGKHDYKHLAEEIADVLICISMLQDMYEIDGSDIQLWIDLKQKRIVERMKQDESHI